MTGLGPPSFAEDDLLSTTSQHAGRRINMCALNALYSAESGVCRSIPASPWLTEVVRSLAARAIGQEPRSARRTADAVRQALGSASYRS
jgi:hypothetical protein